jgi:hypothetical protein
MEPRQVTGLGPLGAVVSWKNESIYAGLTLLEHTKIKIISLGSKVGLPLLYIKTFIAVFSKFCLRCKSLITLKAS